MTNAKLSRELRELVLDGMLKESVLESSFGRSYLKFDRISIRASGVSFSFCGKEMFYVDFPAGFNINTDVFQLDGIEGKMQCSIST